MVSNDVAKLRRALKAKLAKVSKVRDELREVESDAAEVACDCDDAMEHLESAIDALSRLC